VPTGLIVRPGRKRKGSGNDAPANKKPRLEAENTDALEDDMDLPRGTLVTCVVGIELGNACPGLPLLMHHPIPEAKAVLVTVYAPLHCITPNQNTSITFHPLPVLLLLPSHLQPHLHRWTKALARSLRNKHKLSILVMIALPHISRS
jgi:hypothetical protein